MNVTQTNYMSNGENNGNCRRANLGHDDYEWRMGKVAGIDSGANNEDDSANAVDNCRMMDIRSVGHDESTISRNTLLFLGALCQQGERRPVKNDAIQFNSIPYDRAEDTEMPGAFP